LASLTVQLIAEVVAVVEAITNAQVINALIIVRAQDLIVNAGAWK
jgi:hypothetical protein